MAKATTKATITIDGVEYGYGDGDGYGDGYGDGG